MLMAYFNVCYNVVDVCTHLTHLYTFTSKLKFLNRMASVGSKYVIIICNTADPMINYSCIINDGEPEKYHNYTLR